MLLVEFEMEPQIDWLDRFRSWDEILKVKVQIQTSGTRGIMGVTH